MTGRGRRRRGQARAPRRPRSERKPLTEAAQKRYTAMLAANVTQEHVRDALEKKGIVITRQSIGLVLRDQFVNDDVIDAFCELTNTTRDEMQFPARLVAQEKSA
jgi:Ulp1 family protease